MRVIRHGKVEDGGPLWVRDGPLLVTRLSDALPYLLSVPLHALGAALPSFAPSSSFTVSVEVHKQGPTHRVFLAKEARNLR